MLACFCSDNIVEELLEDKMDKVEFAFRKFDSDGDGFLSWEEFQQVRMQWMDNLSHLENCKPVINPRNLRSLRRGTFGSLL